MPDIPASSTTPDRPPADQPTAPLNSGGTIPLLGLGTWQATGTEAYDATLRALQLGYRHIDTAKAYGNEDQVGRAMADSGVGRDEVFLTTKLPPNDAGKESAVLRESLRKLGTDHLDLWLIHWPPNRGAGVATWRAFVDAQQAGSATAIGVSNYSSAQLDELTQATGIAPAVNQIPWSPYLADPALAAAHADRGVVLEGYSPLRGGVLDDPVIGEIARAHGRTPAQVILRWHLEHDVVAIPKSARPDRIAENFDVLDWSLPPADIARIDGLTRA